MSLEKHNHIWLANQLSGNDDCRLLMKCQICGQVRMRSNHDWNHCICQKCGVNRGIEHDWEGSICRICGHYRKTSGHEHKFELPEGSCIEKCVHCGKKNHKKKHHIWTPINGSCEVKCLTCGLVADIDIFHDWNHCVCRKCGKKRFQKANKNYSEHDWENGVCRRCGARHNSHTLEYDIKSCTRHNSHTLEYDIKSCVSTCTLCDATFESHSWNYCICKICGKNRDYGHNWAGSHENCDLICKECAKVSKDANHSYFYGVCRICGKLSENLSFDFLHKCYTTNSTPTFVRDKKAHKWTRIDTCVKRCTVCGLTVFNHDYKVTGISEGMNFGEMKCVKCGHTGHWNYTDRFQNNIEPQSYTFQVGPTNKEPHITKIKK